MDILKETIAQLHAENPNSLYATAIVVASVVALQLRWWQQHREFEQVYGKANYRPKYNPMSPFGFVLEDWAMARLWRDRFTIYRNSKRDLITLEPTVYGRPLLYTNSIEVVRQIGGGGTPTEWWKAPWAQLGSLYWGNNVLAVNDIEWKKYRKILQPAFNPQMYELVWNETQKLYHDMIVADQWPLLSGQTREVIHAQVFTQRLALCVILSCGFGMPLRWKEETYVGSERVNLDESIKFQADNNMLISHAPKWVLALPTEKMRYIAKCTNTLRSWFEQAIRNKRAELAEILEETQGDVDENYLKKDVFTRLVLASQADGTNRLEDSEIIGNTWSMYFAGHETTASVLAATLCMLAVHKEEQDIVLEEIQKISEQCADETLGFDQYDSLVRTRSCFVEALRMFPAGTLVLREAREDTILHVPGIDANGRATEEALHVSKGTIIGGDMVGIQYNPRLYPNPEVFRPSRWYDSTSDDTFTAFSIGPRVCIGRKFALVEGVCFLAHLLRDFEVFPLLEKGESVEAWKERVLSRTEIKFTLSIADAPLLFKRR